MIDSVLYMYIIITIHTFILHTINKTTIASLKDTIPIQRLGRLAQEVTAIC